MDEAHRKPGARETAASSRRAAWFSVRDPWLPPVISTVSVAPRGLGGMREKFLAHRQSGDFGAARAENSAPFPESSPARA